MQTISIMYTMHNHPLHAGIKECAAIRHFSHMAAFPAGRTIRQDAPRALKRQPAR